MENYFSLVSKEFISRSNQIKQFIKKHPLTIGSFHEILLRQFFKQYLPKWASVGHGFILDKDGEISKESDILIYNSIYYAPIYQLDDLVILPPESVIAVIEVKTTMNSKKILYNAFDNLITAKKINNDIEAYLFAFNTSTLKTETILDYIENYDFSSVSHKEMPDKIYGFNNFVISKEIFAYSESEDKTRWAGYLRNKFTNDSPETDYVFESFFYDIYSLIEKRINQDIKTGINNAWKYTGNSTSGGHNQNQGRLGYSKYGQVYYEGGKKIKPII